MKTKLVYVLTCAPEATYIEQALMAVWSARHWNPDAHIVLIVDDKTDALLTGKRGEILNYISEKMVVPFKDESLSPMYRSRYIKTQVRELVSGDFLFVDSDTICCRSLEEVDDFTCEIGAAADNNVLFAEDAFRDDTIRQVAPICDLSKEQYYFSSGVLFCQDTPAVHKLFALWHKFWQEGVDKGINIDQPAFAKANIEMRHIIQPIHDVYNCVLYTQNNYLADAVILHVSRFQQMSFLFKPKTLALIREQGITPWLSDLILHVHSTYLPYDYSIKHSSCAVRRSRVSGIANAAEIYYHYIDQSFDEWSFQAGIAPFIKQCYQLHCFRLGSWIWLEYKRFLLRNKNNLRANICLRG